MVIYVTINFLSEMSIHYFEEVFPVDNYSNILVKKIQCENVKNGFFYTDALKFIFRWLSTISRAVNASHELEKSIEAS